MCNVGDKKPVYLCSLLPSKMETWKKKIRRETNVYTDIHSIREIYAKRSAYTLFYDILRLRKGEIYV